MASENFRFKRFTVWHDQCAMKVGTDGVLLGAWCPLSHWVIPSSPIRLLDIGTGSGLIALMLAQRLSTWLHPTTSYSIDAIDIDTEAVMQSAHNFALSPWADMLHAHQSPLQQWQSEPYHLIVSNPPYFQNSLKNPDNQRATARHTDTLGYAELISHATRLLAPDGILALVLPIEAETEILQIASQHHLHPTHITHVHSKPGKPAKRILIAFHTTQHTTTLPNTTPLYSTLHIESATSPRSEEYSLLTKDFYL